MKIGKPDFKLLSSAEVCNFLGFFTLKSFLLEIFYSLKKGEGIFFKQTLGISEKNTNSLNLILLKISDFLNRFFAFLKKPRLFKFKIFDFLTQNFFFFEKYFPKGFPAGDCQVSLILS